MGYDQVFELRTWKFQFYNEAEKTQMRGRVYGNPKFQDGTYIHTTRIMALETFDTHVRIYTRNSIYDCYYDTYDMNSAREITDYSEIPYLPLADNRVENGKRLYQRLQETVNETLQKEKETLINTVTNSDEYVIVELSADTYYFFKALYIRTKEGDHYSRDYSVNLGMFQDSVIVREKMNDCVIELRYFPDLFYVQFYEWSSDISNIYVKNTGPDHLIVETQFGVYKIPSQECYKIAIDAAEGRIDNKNLIVG